MHHPKINEDCKHSSLLMPKVKCFIALPSWHRKSINMFFSFFNKTDRPGLTCNIGGKSYPYEQAAKVAQLIEHLNPGIKGSIPDAAWHQWPVL